MKYSKTAMFNFMALCCVLGIFAKKLINPFANIITEILRIPGGISTSFSIMFLVIAAEVVKFSFSDLSKKERSMCASLMALVQGLLALTLGRVGSMGIFMPLSFFSTGIAIDFVYKTGKLFKFSREERMIFSNAAAAVMASLTANVIVFRLPMVTFGFYLCVSAISGTIFGCLGKEIVKKLKILWEEKQEMNKEFKGEK